MRTNRVSVDASTVVTLGESAEAVALIEFANGVSNVIKFGNDSVLDFAQTNYQADHENRGDQNQFSGNDETGFVIEQLLQHVFFPCARLYGIWKHLRQSQPRAGEPESTLALTLHPETNLTRDTSWEEEGPRVAESY
mgnify:CR=1 FL=1